MHLIRKGKREGSWDTRNWRGSGQAERLKRLTAMRRWASSFPLYTTLGAFSPCSDTMFSTANPDVASRNCSKVNSWNAGRSYASSSSVTMNRKTRSQITPNSTEKLIHIPNKTYLQPNQ